MTLYYIIKLIIKLKLGIFLSLHGEKRFAGLTKRIVDIEPTTFFAGFAF